DAIISAVRFSLSTKAVGFLPPTSWAYVPDQIRTSYTYDAKKAEALLDEAGWQQRGPDGIRTKDGQRFSFTLWASGGGPLEQYITTAQQYLKAVGIEANPRPEENRALVERFAQRHDFECYIAGFGGLSFDPDQASFFTTDSYENGFNRPKYSNPQVDA